LISKASEFGEGSSGNERESLFTLSFFAASIII
jgi:hypothetical protein